jgi:hypothetical protein
MASIILSNPTEERLARLFQKEQQPEARRILIDACRGYESVFGEVSGESLERFHIAALKISKGSLEKLRLSADLMQIDYRDLLVGAGFANDVKAHLKWLPGEK